MRVLSLALFFFSLCFAAERFSNLFASTKLALEDIEKLCTKAFCSDKIKFQDNKSLTLLTFKFHLGKLRCSENIVILPFFLDMQLYNYICSVTRKAHPLKGNDMPSLNSLNYHPDSISVERLNERLKVHTKLVESLKKQERVIGEKILRLLTNFINILESSLDRLPTFSDTEDIDVYLTTIQHFAEVQAAFFYTAKSGSSLDFLNDLIQEDKYYCQLYCGQTPFLKIFDGFLSPNSGIPAFLYLRRHSLFANAPNLIHATMVKARHAVYIRSNTGQVYAHDLCVSKYAEETRRHFGHVEGLLEVLSKRRDLMLQELNENPAEMWPGRLLIRGLALFVSRQLNSVDPVPVTISTIGECSLFILGRLHHSDTTNLDNLRKTSLSILEDTEFRSNFAACLTKTADHLEAILLGSQFITPKNLLLVEGVVEMVALSIAICTQWTQDSLMKPEYVTGNGLKILNNLTHHLLLRTQNNGRFKGIKYSQLDDHIQSFILEERKRLGLPLPQDKSVDQLEESIILSGSPEKESPLLSIPKKRKAAKRKKLRKTSQAQVPEMYWDDGGIEEEGEINETVEPAANEQPSYCIEEEDASESSEESEELTQLPPSSPDIPLHFELLIIGEDLDLMETVSAKDLSYAYLLLGNKIYMSLLRPFLVELERQGIFLFTVFRRSMKAFCTEIQMLFLRNRLVVEAALKVSGIENMKNFANCISFYERRLAVAHPYALNDMIERKAILHESVRKLGGCSHSQYGLGRELIEANKQAFGELNFTWVEATSCDKTFELCVLILSEYLKNDSQAKNLGGNERLPVRELRGHIAHREPTRSEVDSCVDLFKGNPAAHDFLESIRSNLS